MFPPLLLLLVPLAAARRLLRFWEGQVAAAWLGLGGFLLEYVGGVKVVVTGDALPPGERALIISNHRTRIDWLFLWCFAARLKMLSSYRVVLKSDLRSFPFWGWGMSACLFPFIHRGSKNRAADLGRIQRICQYLAELGANNALILFPEGTDLSPSNQQRDGEYAAAQNLAQYRHVLHPRSGAFITSLAALRPTLDAVYDLTLGYVDYTPGERPSELSLLQGRLPHQVHIHVARHDGKTDPLLQTDDTTALEKFLQQSFEQKETMLEAFYHTEDGGSAFSFPTSQSSLEASQSQETYARNVRWAYRWGLAATLKALVTVLTLAQTLPMVLFWAYSLGVFLLFVFVNKVCEGFDTIELWLPVWGLLPRDAQRRKKK